MTYDTIFRALKVGIGNELAHRVEHLLELLWPNTSWKMKSSYVSESCARTNIEMSSKTTMVVEVMSNLRGQPHADELPTCLL